MIVDLAVAHDAQSVGDNRLCTRLVGRLQRRDQDSNFLVDTNHDDGETMETKCGVVAERGDECEIGSAATDALEVGFMP